MTTVGTGDTSPIGRLLEEISWEGRSVSKYRRGGAGLENVLTTEVMLSLSYLPRDHFLGAVIRRSHGDVRAQATLAKAAADAETAAVSVLPEELTLDPAGIAVQPDAVIEGRETFVLVEAKRAGRARFHPEQLAREYLAVLRQSGPRMPLRLLILGAPPPVNVIGQGVRGIPEAIAEQLPNLLDRTGQYAESLPVLIHRIPAVVSWITWSEVRQVVAEQHDSFEVRDESLTGTVDRLVGALHDAVETHTKKRSLTTTQ